MFVVIQCKDCRFWTKQDPGKRRCPPGFGSCSSPLVTYGYGSEAEPPSTIIVENDEGWGFYTSEIFGCANAEPKKV